MQATLSKLKTRRGKYVNFSDKQDICVMKDGKSDKVLAARALFGILPSHVDLDLAREERLSGTTRCVPRLSA